MYGGAGDTPTFTVSNLGLLSKICGAYRGIRRPEIVGVMDYGYRCSVRVKGLERWALG